MKRSRRFGCLPLTIDFSGKFRVKSNQGGSDEVIGGGTMLILAIGMRGNLKRSAGARRRRAPSPAGEL